MEIRKTLTSIILAGALTLGIAGCSKHSQYVYDGKIGEEQVIFTDKFYLGNSQNILIVTKPSGRVIKYADIFKDDLKLEFVEITAYGQTTKYNARNEVGKPILEEAQKQFDGYLQQIKQTKIDQGLENLK